MPLDCFTTFGPDGSMVTFMGKENERRHSKWRGRKKHLFTPFSPSSFAFL